MDGWYIGPVARHYRCVKCYVPKSHAERITDTVAIIPDNIPIPEVNIEDHVKVTSEDLIALLTSKAILKNSTMNE